MGEITLANAQDFRDEIRRVLSGKLIMYGGIDKGGKGTVFEVLQLWVETLGFKAFNINPYQKEHNDLPSPNLLLNYDCVFCSEPTYSRTGRELREEILKHLDKYTAKFTSGKFSDDRFYLDTNLIDHLRTPKNHITSPTDESSQAAISSNKGNAPVLPVNFKERGIESSLFYQPVQARMRGEELTQDYILSLPGNIHALYENPPDCLTLVHCKAEVAVARMRKHKEDDCKFELIESMRQIEVAYRDPKIADLFRQQGTFIQNVDTTDSNSPQETAEMGIKSLLEYINYLRR